MDNDVHLIHIVRIKFNNIRKSPSRKRGSKLELTMTIAVGFVKVPDLPNQITVKVIQVKIARKDTKAFPVCFHMSVFIYFPSSA